MIVCNCRVCIYNCYRDNFGNITVCNRDDGRAVVQCGNMTGFVNCGNVFIGRRICERHIGSTFRDYSGTYINRSADFNSLIFGNSNIIDRYTESLRNRRIFI